MLSQNRVTFVIFFQAAERRLILMVLPKNSIVKIEISAQSFSIMWKDIIHICKLSHLCYH